MDKDTITREINVSEVKLATTKRIDPLLDKEMFQCRSHCYFNKNVRISFDYH